MSVEEHHRAALIETARAELDRAHRAALSVEAGEVRRGLTLALAALRSAAEDGAPDGAGYSALADRVAAALADLDTGSLAEMETLIEGVRKAIEA